MSQINLASSQAKGLIAAFDLDTTGRAFDISERNNNGVPTGNPKVVAGPEFNATSFNGSTDYISAGNASSLLDLANDNMSVCFWIKPVTGDYEIVG
jgi:hypothetical protein